VNSAPRVFAIAGEPSGDALGGPLLDQLRALNPDIRFDGVGGPLMEAQGLRSLFPMSELSVMGLAEVLPRIPALLRRIAETAKAIERLRPDVVVTIDSPDFTHRVAARIRHLGIPVVHYVAPTVWAWRPSRARKLAKLVDHVMTLFPFEPPYFEREGLAATFVGHPVVERAGPQPRGDAFRSAHDIGVGAPVIGVLPGSRRGELARHLPIFGAAVSRLAECHAGLRAVVPTLPHLEAQVSEAATTWGVPATVIAERGDFENALAACNVALAASGTVVLELARARLPAVVGYRMNPLTGLLARRLVKLDHVSLINILLDRTVMPERLLGDCRPERLAADLDELLTHPESRDRQIAAFEDALNALQPDSGAPSRRAAETVLAVLENRRQSPA